MHPKNTIPYGYCHCGCGEKTSIANYTDGRRQIRKGDPLPFLRGHRSRLTFEDRFWSRADRSGGPGACWEWRGNVGLNGYGRYGQRLAHRLAYEITHGEIPADRMACHTCDNRRCVNPAHIYAGTAMDNYNDVVERNPTRAIQNLTVPQRGEVNKNSKLTADRVRSIRRDLAAGMPGADVAKKYGISQSNVSFIRQRKTWAWLED